MAKIEISFKNNTKERELYNYFSKLEDKSGDIKRILEEWYFKNIGCTNKEHDREIRKQIKDIRDF